MSEIQPPAPGEPVPGLRMWGIGRALLATIFGMLGVVVLTVLTSFWILGWPSVPREQQLVTADLFSLLKLGFAVAAGGAAIAALVSGYRRQRVAEARQRLDEASHAREERAASLSQRDAQERRITEIYSSAANQIGSDKASVRLAGLYSLERLGAEAPHLRQVIVNVVCAYLRMPYTSQPDGPDEEYQVRLAAQWLLSNHLAQSKENDEAVSAERHWPGMDLDLTGAHLYEMNLRGLSVRDLVLDHAILHGTTSLAGAQVAGSSRWIGVRIDGEIDFTGATFRKHVNATAAVFSGPTDFTAARFEGDVLFSNAEFGEFTIFHEAFFGKRAGFGGTCFRQGAWFEGATFAEDAAFGMASSGADMSFSGATFGGRARFGEVEIDGFGWFAEARFVRSASFGGARLQAGAGFDSATFLGGAWFDSVTFGSPASFAKARFAGDVRFTATPTGSAGVGGFNGALVRQADEARRTWPPGWGASDHEAMVDPDGSRWQPVVRQTPTK